MVDQLINNNYITNIIEIINNFFKKKHPKSHDKKPQCIIIKE